MDRSNKFTFGTLQKALLAFGYEVSQRGSHLIYRHAEGTQPVVLPNTKPNERANPTHITIAETAASDDGIATREDFRFFLKNKKMPGDTIKKGDKLLWTAPGMEAAVPVVAAAGETDGMVIIKQKGAFAPCPVEQLRKVS